MPLINIIIPTYNSACYLSETLDSALCQTYQDFEIIIVDDGSRDNTQEIINSYIKDYPEKIQYLQEEHQGVSAARNRGIALGQGKYIAFLDSDDIWLPEKLRLQVNILSAHPDAAMIFTDAESFNKNGIIRCSKSRSQIIQRKNSFRFKILQKQFNDGSVLKSNLYEEMLTRNIVTTTSTVLIDREKLQTIGIFNESISVCEDYDLWLRIALKYPFLYLNAITTKYRVRNEGLSGGDIHIRTCRYAQWRGKMLETHLASCPHKYKRIIKKKASQSFRDATWGYLNQESFREAKKMSKLSLKYNKLQIKLYLCILILSLPKKLIVAIRGMKQSMTQIKMAILGSQ